MTTILGGKWGLFLHFFNSILIKSKILNKYNVSKIRRTLSFDNDSGGKM